MNSLSEIIDFDIDYLHRKAKAQFDAMAGGTVWFTGAAGFLGYYFCQAVDKWNQANAKDKQIRLLAIDNYQRGIPEWLSRLVSENVEVVEFDVIQPIPKEWAEPTYIIHAASIASPTFYRQYPLETIDANVQGLRNMLDFAREHRQVKGMLYFSTSEIYGDPPADQIPTKETFRGLVSCTGPRACYDESKRLGETLCVVYADKYDVPVKVARPFNNYGPGLKLADGRVIPDFVMNLLEGKNIELLSDGSPTRTFCYITDGLDGYLKILTDGTSGEAYNIGIDQDEISIADLANLMVTTAQELWQYSGEAVFGVSDDPAYLEDNPNRRCPDITKARTELTYNPQVSIQDGIRRSLLWYQFSADQG